MDKMKVCHDVLRAENQPFADERDKKKFLDLVEEQKKEKELDIFAFCVTDEECHFLVLGDSEGKLAEAADAVVRISPPITARIIKARKCSLYGKTSPGN